jgi:hypothetical protein
MKLEFKSLTLEGSEDESPDAPESDVPCLGSWHHGMDGSDFDCDYWPDFGCEECVVNGGDRDPRQEAADASIMEDFKDNKGPLYDGVKLLAWHFGYLTNERTSLEAKGSYCDWCLTNVRAPDGTDVLHEFEGINEADAKNPVAALRAILAEPPFCDLEKFKAVAAQIAQVKSPEKSPEVKP